MFKPEKFLEFVETIRRDSKLQTSAGVRTALNRTYFSALVNAKLKLEQMGETFSDNEELHKEILEKIKRKNSQLGDKLEKLYDYRIQSDYDMEFDADKNLISPIYGLAKRFNKQADSELK